MKVAVRCPNFPECRCGDDCTRADRESPVARQILFGLMIGAGLLYWSFLP